MTQPLHDTNAQSLYLIGNTNARGVLTMTGKPGLQENGQAKEEHPF